MRIPFEELKEQFARVLRSLEFEPVKAEAIARIFASNSLDGVYSHGLNRFPVFVDYVNEGLVNKDAEPVAEDRFGALERYDGRLGPGVLNAAFAMNRATELAAQYGIGGVAMRNTNHWMRGGTYGWQAADAGFIGICFTNTIANMPPWGGRESRLGNNPLVIAVPRSGGHVVLDMAMSQFSFGKIAGYRAEGKRLPVNGGYDAAGNPTDDPATILETMRGLPVGFWKGSGLSLALDLLATVLTQGRSTAEITRAGKEYGVSQVFLAVRPAEAGTNDALIESILEYTRSAGGTVRYPGEQTLQTRLENTTLGIPVDPSIWERVLGIGN